MRLFQAVTGAGGAASAVPGDTQIAAQILECAGSTHCGFVNLAVGDSLADTNVHDGTPVHRYANENDSILRKCESVSIAFRELLHPALQIKNRGRCRGFVWLQLASVASRLHVRLQIVRQADLFDQGLLGLEPVDCFFTAFEQFFE